MNTELVQRYIALCHDSRLSDPDEVIVMQVHDLLDVLWFAMSDQERREVLK